MNIRVEPMASGTEPTLRDVVRVVWRARRGTLAGIVVGGALAAAYLNLTPKVYEAEIVVAPANQSDTGQLGGILGQLGGVGALMGVNIPMQGDGQDALATMRSRALAQAFVESEQLAPIMFPERWDARRNDWKSGRREPSMAEIVRHFDEKVRFVEEDRRTGMVSLRIRLASRAKVAPLANQYVALVNERLRDRAIRDAESALEYLRVQLAATGEVEIRQSI